MPPKIFAHRGASGDAPENTLAAFRLAIAQHADGIELDVQMTSDGKVVVIHDETLDRTTNRRGKIAELTYAEIRQADAGKQFPRFRGERVPLLEEVLALLAVTDLQLNIELKNSIVPYIGMEEAVLQLVRKFGMAERVVLSSFNPFSLAKLAALAPQLECGLLYSGKKSEPWQDAAAVGARALHPEFRGVTREFVRRAHEYGLRVRPYTVNRGWDIRRMIGCGVDAVITNYPLRMKRILANITDNANRK